MTLQQAAHQLPASVHDIIHDLGIRFGTSIGRIGKTMPLRTHRSEFKARPQKCHATMGWSIALSCLGRGDKMRTQRLHGLG